MNNTIKVYNKKMELLATFTDEGEGLSPEAMQNLMVAPTVRLESGCIATFSYQMLADSEKFKQINDPENIYVVDGRYYTTLNEAAFEYTSEEDVSVVNVVALEIESLLSRQYHQAFNCSLYVYCRARFLRYTTDGAVFQLYASGASNPGESVSSSIAWEHVKTWTAYDKNNNRNTFAILTADKYKPTNWKDAPSGVFMKSFSVSGNTATMTIESRAKTKVNRIFSYNSGRTYTIDTKPLPFSIDSVKINSTVITSDGKNSTYTTSDKNVSNYHYNSSTGVVTVNYYPSTNEQVNAVTITYIENDLGEISPNATATFAFGAEAVDEHTFVVLPKSDKKYKLTIDGITYEDSKVRDSRGVVMPRGSGGYAMWAALRNTGWNLGVCDVIATGFDASVDYGCFNIESDMKDSLYNIQYIQQLYGGILDWDSAHKILNYRAENYEDYNAYRDGFNDWKGYVFREGKNMIEKPVISYDNTLITRAYLLGYGNLNVKAVNGGRSYIDNFSYTNDVYEGYLKQDLIYDTNDEGGQRQLLYWGQKELKKQCRPRKSVTLSVTDLRTVEGLEHEVFDINEIVKVYYYDEQSETNVIEEQRVITWEYNPFAMWDCTVELGDKTRNKTDLFKLIYKKQLNQPGTDNMGNISGGNIDISGGGDSFNQNSLTNYIQLIARTTTENSDAIAGLILDTSATHAQVDLFAQYQKQTDKLFTQSYAGLTFYADEKKSEAIVSANKYTETKTKELDGTLSTKISITEAAFKTYADEKGSELEALATGYYKETNEKIGTIEEKVQSGFTAEQNARYALAQQFSSFQTKINGEITNIYNSGFITYADAESAAATVVAEHIDRAGYINRATMESYVDNAISQINLSAEFERQLANVKIVAEPSRSYIKFIADHVDFYVADRVTVEYADWYFNYSSTLHLESGALYLAGYKLKVMYDTFVMADGSHKTVNFVSFDR